MSVRVRFAPSPTGHLHMGGLRTALYNWLFARQQAGVFILRIEDTDRSRRVEGAVENLIAALNWVGLDYDEGPGKGGDAGPYVQSERLELYHQHVQQLVDGGAAYYCFCTPERLAEVRERQREIGQAPKYDRRCRSLPRDEAATRAAAEAHVVRLAIPEEGRLVYDDIIRGKVAFDLTTVDDQILLKGDGFPTYHLANVVDDHLMGVTHVIRGEEWIPSMPKHLQLYQAFGWEPPRFAHLPLLLNKDRSKLSKRRGHVTVKAYRQQGYLSQALINFVALLGWHDKTDKEVFSLAELVEAFELERVQKGGAIFDLDKLLWINGQHIRRLSREDFKVALRPHLDVGWEVTDAMAASLQSRLDLLSEARDQLAFFFEEPVVYDGAAREALSGPQAPAILMTVLQRLEEASVQTGDQFLEVVKALGQELGLTGRELWHPIRAAIAGRTVGPDMVTIVDTFGVDKCRQRLQEALQSVTA